MRIVLAGQKAFGAAAYDLIRLAGHEVVAVWSPAQSGADRDRLRVKAEEGETPWRMAGTLTAESLPANTELIVAAHSHDFIGRGTRLRSSLGAIGYHPSLLPLHRGRDAVRWTIRMRERIAGGSMYWLSDSVDGGDIAAQDWCFVRPEDTAAELWRRELFPIGARLLARVLRDLASGVMVRIPQDDALATWEPAMDAPPLRRPDLPMVSDGRAAGYVVVRDRLERRTNGDGRQME